MTTQTVFYRDTQIPVGCSRLIVNNPFGDKTILQFERYAINNFLGQTEMRPINPPATYVYDRSVNISALSEEDQALYHFSLPEGLIPNVSSLSSHQIFGVMVALFAEINKRQESLDIAEEARQASIKALNVPH